MMKNKNNNNLVNILFNIVLPVVVLKQLSERTNPSFALLLALFFPVAYFFYEYYKTKTKNLISILGFLNILFTGGLALLQVKGIWFAVKEAAFPLIIGIGVYLTKYTDKPAIKWILFNENIVDVDLVKKHTLENNSEDQLNSQLKKSTVLFAISFFISAVLNFVLARVVFVDIDTSLTKIIQQNILNDQIARMTWLGYVVIALPLTLFMFLIGYDLVKGIKKATNLEMEQIFSVLQNEKSN